MTFVSYAQNFEDVMLWRALGQISLGFYIDVGAAWPDEDSVTKAFYDRGWRGINIEPNPSFYRRLENERPNDTNLMVAVSDHSGTLSMNFIEGTGLSTLEDSVATKHAEEGLKIQRQDVLLMTLSSIIEKHKPADLEIQFLKVDVEGLETAVLRGNDWSRFRPWIVLVEATLPMSQVESYDSWEPTLIEADYIFAYADGLNRFYIAKEHADLVAAFKFPPNVFDGFVQINQQKTAIAQTRVAEERAARAEIAQQDLMILLEQANTELQQYKESYARLETSLRIMLSSNSWRITAPLRWVTTQLGRLAQDGLSKRIRALFLKIYRKCKSTPINNLPSGSSQLTPRGFIIYKSLKKEAQSHQRGQH